MFINGKLFRSNLLFQGRGIGALEKKKETHTHSKVALLRCFLPDVHRRRFTKNYSAHEPLLCPGFLLIVFCFCCSAGRSTICSVRALSALYALVLRLLKWDDAAFLSEMNDYTSGATLLLLIVTLQSVWGQQKRSRPQAGWCYLSSKHGVHTQRRVVNKASAWDDRLSGGTGVNRDGGWHLSARMGQDLTTMTRTRILYFICVFRAARLEEKNSSCDYWDQYWDVRLWYDKGHLLVKLH